LLGHRRKSLRQTEPDSKVVLLSQVGNRLRLFTGFLATSLGILQFQQFLPLTGMNMRILLKALGRVDEVGCAPEAASARIDRGIWPGLAVSVACVRRTENLASAAIRVLVPAS
jgi:hypothetical protein